MHDKEFDLTTPRLELRPLDDTDVASLVRHWGDAQVRRYLWDDKPVTVDMVNAIVTTSDRDFKRAGFGIWAVRLKGEQSLIGMCGLRQVRNSEAVEILYSLRPRYWHNGFATEAAHAILRYGFERIGLEDIVASYDFANVASAGVLKRLGMVEASSAAADDDHQAAQHQAAQHQAAQHRAAQWHLTREKFRRWTVPPTLPPPQL